MERLYGERGARIYDITTRLSGYRGYYRAALSAANVPREGAVLDVGCGTGMFGAALAEHGRYDIVGVDLSPAMLRIAEENVPSASLYRGDAFHLDEAVPFDHEGGPLTDRKYDLVVTAGMLEYLDSPERALEEMLRLAKPGGSIIVTMIRNNLVGNIASKLYRFTLLDTSILQGADADVEEIRLPASYRNAYLRTLKQSHLLEKRR